MIYPNDLEIEKKAIKLEEDMKPWNLSTSCFTRGATWAIAEIQRRSVVGFDAFIDNESTYSLLAQMDDISEVAKTVWQASQLSQVKKIKELEKLIGKAATQSGAFERDQIKIAALESRLKDANEALIYYANIDSYLLNEYDDSYCLLDDSDCESVLYSDDGERFKRDDFAGKRARSYFTKYPDAKESKGAV